MSARVAVFSSGGGSNLQAILDHFASLGAGSPGRVVIVISDRAAAGALDRARQAGIAAKHIPFSAPAGMLAHVLHERGVDVVALAGYLRLIPPDVTREYRGRIVNVHPALLPAFGGPGMYGASVHRAVLASGAKVSGATIHFVDDEYDHGAIIAQARVPVEPQDTPETLGARVLAAEHELYPRTLAQICASIVSSRPPHVRP